MSLGGITPKDILPIPDNIGTVTDPHNQDVSNSLADEPTASHALAVADHDEKGHAQEQHDHEALDLGWHEDNNKIPDPLVGGIGNEDLWILIRRFNKQVYDVRELSGPVAGNLDLNIADDEAYSPDKMRACIERFYVTVAMGLLSFGKHVARIRSWNESRRTAVFCAVYFIAWLVDLLIPLFTLTLVTLIVYPPSRDLLFPPAPIALVSATTGGVQKPKAGILGSTDSATGAPENLKGEAVEAEATNFVSSMTSIALASASGKHPQDDPQDASKGRDGLTRAPGLDPTAVAIDASNARINAVGKPTSTKQDKTKLPMENAMWNKMRPIMHSLSDIIDTWERFGNALSPAPPFPGDLYRLRLAALIVPLLAGSIFISSYMFMKGLTFGVGAGFFGDPVMQPALQWLNTNFPNWQKLLEVRNTILKGVPTNAQLAITLLRIGEANNAPLPPPPSSEQPPPDEPVGLSNDGIQNLNATNGELQAAIEHDPNVPHEVDSEDVAAAKQKSHGKKGKHILSVIKGSAKASIESALGADHLKAKIGSEHSKQRLGVIPDNKEVHLTGPVDFKCRYHGKRGHAYIRTRGTTPCISYSLNKTITDEGTANRADAELKPIWSVAVGEIKEIKKVGGLGWKAKLAVGWALGREVADGIEIIDRQGNSFMMTAMVLRDELFNRLVAIGGQKWEAC